ncbi:MAG: L-2-amino-thiazoline-4-carboxylic acid hydrolase [Treponema sp.]|nr:L-2-amino-thiazoline-4-carboxylic acid hydrolase [Treponema sp.]
MSISNKAKKNGSFIRNLRNFYEHRALWMYFLCDEARKKGIKPENFAPAAVRRCGIYHGMRAITGKDEAVQAAGGKGDSCRMLRKKLFPATGKAIFEMKFLKLDDDAFDVDFHYCPLVNAWKKQGCSDEEIDKLCDWAMEGDRGIAETFGCELELKKTIAKGDGVCQIRFKRKK